MPALDRALGGDPQQLTIAVSAAGVWHTSDGGASWQRRNRGIVSPYLPEGADPEEQTALCVHRMDRAARQPERMFMQFHGGVYRSDDAGPTGPRSAAACPPTSASRSSSTRPTPTART